MMENIFVSTTTTDGHKDTFNSNLKFESIKTVIGLEDDSVVKWDHLYRN